MGNDYYVYFVIGILVYSDNIATGEIYQETYLLKLDGSKDKSEGLREYLELENLDDVNILRCEVLGNIDNINY